MPNIETQIFQWEDFLSTKDEYDFVWEEFEKYKWEFIAGEHHSSPPFPLRTFWFKELMESKLEPLFKSKVEEFLGLKIRSNRIYGNGQSYGQDAFMHRDQNPLGDERDNLQYGTLVYYLHPAWLPHYGGHLIFVEPQQNDDHIPKVISSIFPRSNSAVLFNSKIEHMAFAPSIYCTHMRISIGYKFCILKNQE